MALPIDVGGPIPAFPAGAEQGLALFTTVCPAGHCKLLHLQATEIRDVADVPRTPLAPHDGLLLALDVEKGQLEAGDDRAEAWLASDRGAWLPAWVRDNAALLSARFERLKRQQNEPPPDTGPAPAWKPNARILHRDLFPHDFALRVEHAGKPWAIVDGYCADPACACEIAALSFVAEDGQSAEAEGRLDDRLPTKANGAGKALWKAVQADPMLVDSLRERRDDVRDSGPFIVGAAYEKARLVRRGEAPAAAVSAEGGYLQGGAIPEALVRRLFDTSVRLYAGRLALGAAWLSWIRVEVQGAFERRAWALLEDQPFAVELFEATGDATPWLVFSLSPREEISPESRRQRCALGLPLLGGTSLPLVEGVRRDESLRPPDADEVRLAIALGEALLAAPLDEVAEAAGAARVFEHRVELDTGALDVRLTPDHAEALSVTAPAGAAPSSTEPRPSGSAPAEALSELDDGALDDDDDLDDGDDLDDLDDDGALDDDEALDEEDEPSHALTVEPLLEAFTDEALDRGVEQPVVETARRLLFAAATYAFEEGAGLVDERTWSRFLSDYAPRNVLLEKDDIAQAPAALHALADWLAANGHVDARGFRVALDRVMEKFQKRARTPRDFSPAKTALVEMRAAGVDMHDPDAIERFIDARSAAPAPLPPPSPISTAAVPPAPAPNPASVTRSPNRWSPGPGERWPAPTDPCGCGSGKRFKKCCMAR